MNYGNVRGLMYRFLRWSERYTKTDMVYLSRGSFFSAVAQGTGLVTTLALSVVVSHYIPKEIYGTYKYILSVVAILSLFSLNSIGTAVFQSTAQGFDGALVRAFWVNIRWSVGVFLGALGTSLFYFIMDNSTLAISILIGGAFSPFLASANLFSQFLNGKKDFYRGMLYTIVDNGIPTLIFIGVILLTTNPIILIATYFTTNTAAALYFYRRTIHVYHSRLHVQDNSLVGYSTRLSLVGVLTGLAQYLDQIVIFHFLGGTQLATYGFATAIPDMVKTPVKNVGVMLQPQFVKRTGEEIQHGMNRKLLLMSIGSIGVTITYIAVAPLIFHTFFPAYADAIWYSQLYALWILTSALDPVATYLVARKLTVELYVNSGVFVVVGITSVLVGVLYWGLVGVIFARIFTRAMVAITNYILYRRALAREIGGAHGERT